MGAKQHITKYDIKTEMKKLINPQDSQAESYKSEPKNITRYNGANPDTVQC